MKFNDDELREIFKGLLAIPRVRWGTAAQERFLATLPPEEREAILAKYRNPVDEHLPGVAATNDRGFGYVPPSRDLQVGEIEGALRPGETRPTADRNTSPSPEEEPKPDILTHATGDARDPDRS